MVYQDVRYRDPEYLTKWRDANPEKVRAQKKRHLERYREANRLRASAHYYANREHRQAQARAYYATHREQHRVTALVRTFGLTRDAYLALLERSGGQCEICGIEARLSIDHDHDSGRVRGLLCAGCNFMIGHGKDDPSILRRAANYLETHGA